ncbi:MAG TPA: endolytic transglycosylase MltG, partial [Candidatus Deferrimicrobium sp.]|nr:endolytic transglycosylase MltG [Candidatus Deferrimicrobium sp.]
NTLKKGPESTAVRVTIPEGFTTKQIVDLLVQEKLIDKEKFMSLVKSKDFGFSFLQGLPQSEARLEGFLFPDTYEIAPGTSEEEIISLMLKRFEQELTPEVKAAISQKALTVQNFVTLASLIEREAREPEDRPVISQVFQKRLRIGMPLQSCASIQFILGTAKPVLSLKDLEVKSPYNTYKNTGLPPGPIANPGRAALLAAAFPASTDYLYFVAKSDGYHAFAKSYEEHLRNVKKYEQ